MGMTFPTALDLGRLVMVVHDYATHANILPKIMAISWKRCHYPIHGVDLYISLETHVAFRESLFHSLILRSGSCICFYLFRVSTLNDAKNCPGTHLIFLINSIQNIGFLEHLLQRELHNILIKGLVKSCIRNVRLYNVLSLTYKYCNKYIYFT